MCELFNNATVAAFFGAFFAFLLVVATDLRRRYLVRTLLTRNIASAKDLAEAKLQTVVTNIALVREDNRITAAPIMEFPLRAIEEQKLQVLDLLTSSQSQALEALLYWMRAIDDLIAEGVALAKKVKALSRVNGPDADRISLATEYLELMGEAEKNIGYLRDLLAHYLNGRPELVLEFKHPIGDRK
ncbi:hypothetical protein [Rhodoferax sp.]|uniref:hypothetical protein n=1 Tax=Rhodoferax sp. TaxID=50421 RepID=UPI0026165DDA|nr:hypothetical protein [Rhodoferax sp.]MDD3937047.1 hypothetical protein [Rhodoferax sp.]